MTACLEFEKKTGRQMDPQEYEKCAFSIENFLNQASSEPFSGSDTNGDFSSLPEKNYQDWPSNINLLLSTANRRASFTFQRRANPARWARAADAYIILVTENKEHFRSKPKHLLNLLLKEGEHLKYSSTDKLSAESARFYYLLESLIGDYKAAAKDVASAAADRRQRAAIDSGATHTWLSQADLWSITRKQLPETSKRAVLFADNWPVIRTELAPQNKEPARGEGIPLGAFPNPALVWELFSSFPPLFGSELLGLGTIHLRYYTDVFNPEYLADPASLSLWGEPLVTIFAYSVKPPRVAPLKPIAFAHPIVGWKTIMFTECNRAPLCKYLRDYNPAARLKQFDWPIFLRDAAFDKGVEIVPWPSAVSQIETRLEQVLIAQHRTLREEVQREDSDLARAISKLDKAASLIRGLLLMTKPQTIERNDRIRAVLFGRPQIVLCEIQESRVWSPKEAKSKFLPKAVESLGGFEDAVQASAAAATSPDKKCGTPASANAGKVEHLVDGKIIRLLLDSLSSIEVQTRAKFMNRQTLLMNVDTMAQESSEYLLNSMGAEIASGSPNHHVFIEATSSRLEALTSAFQ
jgi:hypothetical protein